MDKDGGGLGASADFCIGGARSQLERSEDALSGPPPGVSRRHFVHGIAATAAAMAAAVRPTFAQVPDGARTAIAGAATAFLSALPADGRRRAVFPFDQAERLNWGYVPRSREGVAFKDMPAGARTAAHELMKASLSAAGYAKAVNVTRLEEVLRQMETFGSLLRDQEKYFVSVFGVPGGGPWGWRLEGHHLSLNFT